MIIFLFDTKQKKKKKRRNFILCFRFVLIICWFFYLIASRLFSDSFNFCVWLKEKRRRWWANLHFFLFLANKRGLMTLWLRKMEGILSWVEGKAIKTRFWWNFLLNFNLQKKKSQRKMLQGIYLELMQKLYGELRNFLKCSWKFLCILSSTVGY